MQLKLLANKVRIVQVLFLIVSVIFIIYGYLARFLSLYYFWESKDIGWVLLFLSGLLYFIARFRDRAKQETGTGEIIGTGLIAMVLFEFVILPLSLHEEGIFKLAKRSIARHTQLPAELGNIKGYYLVPRGQFTDPTKENNYEGTAAIILVIKGERKFAEVELHYEKSNESGWSLVRAIRIY